MTIYPSTSLKDTDLQTVGIILNLTIPDPLLFVNRSSRELATLITFRLTSASGEVDGFDYTYGNEPHDWCAVSTPSLQTITCQIPANPYYSLTASETIVVTLSDTRQLYTNATSFWCRGERITLVQLKVSSTKIPAAAEFIKDGSVVAGGGAVIVGILTGASTMDIQAIALLLSSDCASSLDKQSTSLLRYFLSPFIDLGNVYIIIGNMCVILLLAALQGGLATFFRHSRHISRIDAWAAVRFPSLSFGVLALFYKGLCYGVFRALKSGSTAEVVVGIFGLLVAIAVPGCVCYAINNLFTAKFIQYTQFLSKPPTRRWLYPMGFWDPPAMRLAFGNVVGGMTAEREFFAVTPLIVSFCTTLVLCGLPFSCTVRLTLSTLVFVFAAAVTIIAQYGRSYGLTVLTFLGYLLLGALALVMLVAVNVVSTGLVYGKLAVAMLEILLVLFRVVYKLTLVFMEQKYWRKFQRPELEGLKQDDVNAANANPMLADILEDDDDFFGSLDVGTATVAQQKTPFPRRKRKLAIEVEEESLAEVERHTVDRERYPVGGTADVPRLGYPSHTTRPPTSNNVTTIPPVEDVCYRSDEPTSSSTTQSIFSSSSTRDTPDQLGDEEEEDSSDIGVL